MNTSTPARVRIAPSPTGFVHVGTVRTAIFDWLLAKQTHGQFILRIEDTDQSRFVDGAIEDLLDGLRWLGIEPDEGPGIGGAHGPYVQSERLAIYHEHIDSLLDEGKVYKCFCTPEELQEIRESRSAAGLSGSYDRRCRDAAPERVAEREAADAPYVVRLKMPLEGRVTVRDHLRGDIHFDADELSDPVLLKSDGFPTYQFAVVVDDHLMEITHVLRGQEWISSAPIQVVLYEAFGWEQPVWVHVPLVLRPDGKGKLSKRHGNAALHEYREAGYLPEALVNFLSLVGWRFSGEEEVFTPEQAIEAFRLEDMQTSGARLDLDKLRWLNGVYIRKLEPAALAERILPFLRRADLPATPEEVQRMVPLVQERLVTLAEAVEKLGFFWAESVSPDPEEMIPKKHDAAAALAYLDATITALKAIGEEDWNEATLETALRELAETLGAKFGPLLQPLRLAVTGTKVAPPMFGTLEVLGRAKSLARLAGARSILAARAEREASSTAAGAGT